MEDQIQERPDINLVLGWPSSTSRHCLINVSKIWWFCFWPMSESMVTFWNLLKERFLHTLYSLYPCSSSKPRLCLKVKIASFYDAKASIKQHQLWVFVWGFSVLFCFSSEMFLGFVQKWSQVRFAFHLFFSPCIKITFVWIFSECIRLWHFKWSKNSNYFIQWTKKTKYVVKGIESITNFEDTGFSAFLGDIKAYIYIAC